MFIAPPTPWRHAIHDQGDITVLRQLHGELDAAVATAYHRLTTAYCFLARCYAHGLASGARKMIRRADPVWVGPPFFMDARKRCADNASTGRGIRGARSDAAASAQWPASRPRRLRLRPDTGCASRCGQVAHVLGLQGVEPYWPLILRTGSSKVASRRRRKESLRLSGRCRGISLPNNFSQPPHRS